MALKEVTESTFEAEVLNSPVPVLVDFWASWCGPCRMMSPIVDQIAEEVTDCKVGKINVDEEGELAQQFGIMSIPTLLVFRDGKVANQSVGVRDKAFVIDMIKG